MSPRMHLPRNKIKSKIYKILNIRKKLLKHTTTIMAMLLTPKLPIQSKRQVPELSFLKLPKTYSHFEQN